jgi:alkylated DNA repair dioxygenase AlkB
MAPLQAFHTETDLAEKLNSGTSPTHNKEFDARGYLILPGLCNPDELFHPVPEKCGLYYYADSSTENFTYAPEEPQVQGSCSRYWHPQYRSVHNDIRLKIEAVVGRKLYNTYYFDRYYFPGQGLSRHTDRDACEISVTVHISSTLPKAWPIWIKTPNTYHDLGRQQIKSPGEAASVILRPGDGMIYKGCERPHWRDPMPHSIRSRLQFKPLHYHQIFFHYVLQDGLRAHCAWDRAS